jgi:hypothetical protein
MKALMGVMLVSAWAYPLRAQDTTPVAVDSTSPAVTPLYRNPKKALILGTQIYF